MSHSHFFQIYNKYCYKEKSFQLYQEHAFTKATLRDLASRPDHLDIMDTIENYILTKLIIMQNQNLEEDYASYWYWGTHFLE